MSRRARVAAALTALLALAVPAGAAAASVNSRQLHTLAARAAAGSSSALAQLRTVTAVDGRPAQIAASLNTGDAAQLQSRLAALSAGTSADTSAGANAGPSAADSTAAAQRRAAAILTASQYSKAPVPDPVNNALHDLAKALSRLANGTPGGPAVFWLVAGALVLGLATLGARRMLRRLDPVAQAAAAAARSAGEDPTALEQAAQAAEQRGAFGDAIRLRFRAGLLLLSARRAIEYRPSLLTADVAKRLRSPQFDALAASFERVAYGGAPAAESDAAAARDGWRALLTKQADR